MVWFCGLVMMSAFLGRPAPGDDARAGDREMMVAEQIALGESRILPLEPYLPTRFDGGGFRTAYADMGAMA